MKLGLEDREDADVGTYPALHAVYSGETEEPPTDPEENGNPNNHFENHANGEDANHASQGHMPIPGFLAEANLKTLVLAEAHHPRTEWWKTLTSLTDQLEKQTIVALTATPPFDVSFLNWSSSHVDICSRV